MILLISVGLMHRIFILVWLLVCFVLIFCSGWVFLGFLLFIIFWKDYRYGLVGLLCLGLVLARILVWDFYGKDSLYFKNDDGKSYNFEVQVCLEPDVRRDQVKYVLCLKNGERFLWVDDFLSKYEIGQVLKMECVLEEPFEENGFSYKNYLKIYRVLSICEGRVLSDLGSDGFYIRRGLLRFKNFVISFYDKNLLEPVSSLMSGILLGTRRGFAENIMDDFARTGLTHIIAVSGYNVALVILVVDKMFGFVSKFRRFWIHVAFLLSFAFITGLSASVIRATISGVFALMMVKEGVSSNFVQVILWVVVLMSFWNPAYLFFDVSFHLSVMATIGVVCGGSFCKKCLGSFLEEDGLSVKEALVMTLFAQFFTMPIILLRFDYLSLVSVLANVLVAPILPILMLFGVLLFLFGAIFPWFGWGCILVIEIFGRLFFKIVELCSKLDFLVLELGEINRNFWVLNYMVVFGMVFGFVIWKFYKGEVRVLLEKIVKS